MLRRSILLLIGRSMKTIEQILDLVLEKEGGFVDHPDDKGGPTNFGVTLKTLRAHIANATVDTLKSITKDDAKKIYMAEYYMKTGIFDIYSLSQDIAAELFDTAINMGPKTAITFLQKCLNVFNRGGDIYADIEINGSISLETRAALSAFIAFRGATGVQVILKALNCLQGARYIELAEKRQANESFVYGWVSNRVQL